MPRIGVTSDIHVDTTQANKEIVSHLVEAALASELDALIVCGDISPSLMHIARFLNAFEALKCPKCFIAGNHDIWVIAYDNVTSEQKYRALDAICEACGFHHLAAAPVVVQGVGICGSIGWYDYSFRNHEYQIPLEQYQRKQWGNAVWRDRDYTHWKRSDTEMVARCVRDLQQQFLTLPASVSAILVATHHIPFRQCVSYRGTLARDFFAAFMGSEELGHVCRSDTRVKHVVFGHTHHAFTQEVDGITATSSPVGYLFQQPTEGLRVFAAKRLTVLQIDPLCITPG